MRDRITICSITQTPIDDESERIVFGIELKSKDDEAFISESISRLVENDAEVVELNGYRVLVLDTAQAAGNLDFDEEFDDEFGDDPLAEDEPETEEEIKPAKPLFEKQVFVVAGGFLLIGNNVDQLESILVQISEDDGESRLGEAADYLRVKKALEKLAGKTAPSLRQFGRMDKTLQTNYEMLRTNRMPQSKTLLGQMVNRAYTSEDTAEDFVRVQEVDGSKMPENY